MEHFNQFSYGKSGQGDYGRGFGPMSHLSVDIMKDNILKALDSIPISPKEDALFTIADYGAADGFASMPLIKELIRVVRQKHGEIPIQVVYEDQASTDFNSLFRRVHGLIPDPHHYLNDFRQVYVAATGTSFFQQVLPDNRAHLIMSFFAAHYSSKPAVKFQNSLERFPDATEAECQLVAAQAAQDWETFLLHRARELKAGGMLIVSVTAEDPGMKLEGVQYSTQGYVETMLKVWRQMRDQGKITQREFVDTNFYRCVPYMKELKAPFEDSESRVSKAGLSLLHAETVLVPCLEKKKWMKKLDEVPKFLLTTEGVDDRTTWAKGVVNQHRCWSVHIFIRGLSGGMRSQQEREALVEELYERLEEEIMAQDPREFKDDSLLHYVLVRKI